MLDRDRDRTTSIDEQTAYSADVVGQLQAVLDRTSRSLRLTFSSFPTVANFIGWKG